MHYEWTPEQAARRDAVAALFDDDFSRAVALLELGATDDVRAALAAILPRVAETGAFAAAARPENPPLDMATLAGDLELARRSTSLYAGLVAHRMAVAALARLGGSGAAETLCALAEGRLLGALALSDPGEEIPDHETTLRAEGDGYILNGRKAFVSNGPLAGVFVALARLADGRRALARLDPATPGLRIGPRVELAGLHGLCVGGLAFDDLALPADRVGPPASDQACAGLDVVWDVQLAVAAVGLAERATEEAKRFAQQRKRDGRPVAKYQEVRFPLAEMHALAETARWMTIRAAWLYATGDDEGPLMATAAKLFAVEQARAVTDRGMEAAGGAGYVAGGAIERAWRDARGLAAMGTSDGLGHSAVADAILAGAR